MQNTTQNSAVSAPLPPLFLERLATIYPSIHTDIVSTFSSGRIGSFRINTLVSDAANVLAEMSARDIVVQPFVSLPGVYTYDRVHEYNIKWSQAFYGGKIYIQSISSLLPAYVLSPTKSSKVLDICAAPGGKTTQMSMYMNNTGSIVALEQNQIRYDKMLHNIQLQWATNVQTKKTEAVKYLAADTTKYDYILVDAVCSAEGRIHTDNPKSYGFWSLANISEKAEKQYVLLQSAIHHLAPGGTLVYSTCTLAPEENEAVVSRILAEYTDIHLAPISVPADIQYIPGIHEFAGATYHHSIGHTVRIIPTDTTEGFYIAKIQKK